MGSGRSRRDGARDVDPLADVRQVGVTLLVGPVGCGEEDTSSVTTAAPDWPGRVWSDLVRPGQVWSGQVGSGLVGCGQASLSSHLCQQTCRRICGRG